jgi:hypothetical protein
MQVIWGKNAGGAYIRVVPVASQIGTQDGAASFTDGFPPDNFTNVSAGGVPPFGQDMNGILSVVTAWLQWAQAGGPNVYDAAFATAVGGYPFGSILNSAYTAGAMWASFQDNNLTNPDDPSTSAGWVRVGLQPGTPVPLLTANTNSQFILANGTTVGNTGSGAAQADRGYVYVYKAIWDQFSNTQCPIFDSSGNPSTRGANAVADFLALKRLTTPNMKGLGVIGVDTMAGSASTFLNGVPITIGNTTTPGSILGENLHALTSSENGAHTHVNTLTDPQHNHSYLIAPDSGARVSGTGNIYLGGPQSSGATTGSSSTNITINNASSGSGTGHNTVERNMAVYWGLKT